MACVHLEISSSDGGFELSLQQIICLCVTFVPRFVHNSYLLGVQLKATQSPFSKGLSGQMLSKRHNTTLDMLEVAVQ